MPPNPVVGWRSGVGRLPISGAISAGMGFRFSPVGSSTLIQTLSNIPDRSVGKVMFSHGSGIWTCAFDLWVTGQWIT